MSEIAIRVENLSKQYRVNPARVRNDTIRDALVATGARLNTRIRSTLKSSIDGQSSSSTFWALRDVTFSVNRGEVVGIIGRNGAGKSTLLKILSQITEPTGGRAEIYGRVASLLEVGTGFHPELTGRENIFLNGAILGMRRKEIVQRFDEIVDFAEIERFLDTPVKRYSSGMYVRLAFAVAAHLRPDVLLVDEVLAVGDYAFQQKCIAKIDNVAKRGRTVFLVSHSIPTVLSLCERCILFDGGTIVTDDVAQQTVQKYLVNLHESAGALDLASREDRTGDRSIRVVGINFSGTGQSSELGWITGEAAKLQIEYEATGTANMENIQVAAAIRRLDQSPLVYLSTHLVDQNYRTIGQKGVFECSIPRLPLEAGRYQLNVEVRRNGVKADHIEAARLIDVTEGDYFGSGIVSSFGGVLCEQEWS
jgi:lipopolysaccharide transport system ATP-binding protein